MSINGAHKIPKLSDQQQQTSMIPHLQPSIDAAARVRAYHAYISVEPIDKLLVKAQCL